MKASRALNYAARNTGDRSSRSATMKALWADAKYKEKMLATHRSPESVRASAIRTKALWEDPIYREKLLASWRSPERVAAQSTGLSARWKDPQYKEKMLASIRSSRQRLLQEDPDRNEKMGARLRALWKQQPEKRAEHSEKMKAIFAQDPEKYRAGHEKRGRIMKEQFKKNPNSSLFGGLHSQWARTTLPFLRVTSAIQSFDEKGEPFTSEHGLHCYVRGCGYYTSSIGVRAHMRGHFETRHGNVYDPKKVHLAADGEIVQQEWHCYLCDFTTTSFGRLRTHFGRNHNLRRDGKPSPNNEGNLTGPQYDLSKIRCTVRRSGRLVEYEDPVEKASKRAIEESNKRHGQRGG